MHEGDVGAEQLALVHALDAAILRPVGAEPDVDGDPQAELAREPQVVLGGLDGGELRPARRHGERDQRIVA